MEGTTHGQKHPPWTSSNIEPKCLHISHTRHQPGWSCIPTNIAEYDEQPSHFDNQPSHIGKPNSNQWPYSNGTICQKLSFSFSASYCPHQFHLVISKAGTKSVLLRSSLASATTLVVLSLHDAQLRNLLVTRTMLKWFQGFGGHPPFPADSPVDTLSVG